MRELASVTAVMIAAVAIPQEDLLECAVWGSGPCVHYFWGTRRPCHDIMRAESDIQQHGSVDKGPTVKRRGGKQIWILRTHLRVRQA